MPNFRNIENIPNKSKKSIKEFFIFFLLLSFFFFIIVPSVLSTFKYVITFSQCPNEISRTKRENYQVCGRGNVKIDFIDSRLWTNIKKKGIENELFFNNLISGFRNLKLNPGIQIRNKDIKINVNNSFSFQSIEVVDFKLPLSETIDYRLLKKITYLGKTNKIYYKAQKEIEKNLNKCFFEIKGDGNLVNVSIDCDFKINRESKY